jgi:hypothetical protein
MNRFLVLVLFLFPFVSKAEVLDNISFTINKNCTMEKYISIVDEFRKNPIVQKHGYKVKILSPVSSSNMTVHYWEGTTASVKDFQGFVSEMRPQIATLGSAENKLMAKFNQCITNHSRSVHDEPFEIDTSKAKQVDVWGAKIKDSCSLKEWMGFSTEFNKIVSQYGMKGNIKSPVFTPDINKYYWVNYSNSGEMLQSAQAQFENNAATKGTPENTIQTKIYECLTLTSRETFAIVNK